MTGGAFRVLARLGALWPTLLALVCWVLWSGTETWRQADLWMLDLGFALRGPEAPTGNVVLAPIDDRSVTALGGWPLHRDRLATAVERLSRAGARVVAFDLLLTEPGRAVRDPGLAPDTTADALDLYFLTGDRDGRLTEAIARMGRVVLPFALVFQSAQANVAGLPAPFASGAFAVVTVPPAAGLGLPEPAGILGPDGRLADAAAALGHVTVLLSPDGALRSDRTVMTFDGLYFPSLAVETVRLFEALAREDVRVVLGQSLTIGDRPVPVDRSMRLWVNFRGPAGTFPSMPLVDVLTADDDALSAFVGDRVVLIGAQVLGLGDVFTTPFSDNLAGAEFLATAIDTILAGDGIIRPPWRELAGVGAVLVLGIIVWAAWQGRTVVALGATAIVLSVWLSLCALAFVEHRLWLDAISPPLAALAQAVVCGLVTLRREHRSRLAAEVHRSQLARRVPPAVRRETPVDGTPRPLLATIMFVDLVGFTRAVEHLPPADAMRLGQGFQDQVIRAVAAEGGQIEKFLGDGAMAFFGVDDDPMKAPLHALRAARRLVDSWRHWDREPGGADLDLAVGIHAGLVVAGDMGGDHLTQFTLMGDAVNLASRLEGLCRDHAATVLVSDAVFDAARALGGPDDLEGFEPMGPIAVRGRSQPIAVWRLPRAPAPGETA